MAFGIIDQIIESITYIRLLITFEADEEIILPRFTKGATFRGCMGDAFRKQVCKFDTMPPCEQCKVRFECPFFQLFSNELQKNHPGYGRYTKPPKSYIINPMPDNSAQFDKGSRFWFELILIGESAEIFLPYIPGIIRAMGEEGIGKGHKKFHPVDLSFTNQSGVFEILPAIGLPFVHALSNTRERSLHNKVTLHFETPLRLESNGNYEESIPEFDRFAKAIFKRLALIATIYCKMPWFDIEKSLSEIESGINIKDHHLVWKKHKHFSSETRNSAGTETKEKAKWLNGYTGKITYTGAIEPWSELLWAGERIHVGSTATFGYGKFRIVL